MLNSATWPLLWDRDVKFALKIDEILDVTESLLIVLSKRLSEESFIQELWK